MSQHRTNWRSKAREWAWRYAPAEAAATLGSYLGYFALASLTRNLIAAAYGAAIGENCGFYGLVLAREWRRWRSSKEPAGAGSIFTVLRGLWLEFGPAECADSLLIRPLATALCSRWLGPGWGVLSGKLIADAVFYLLVIVSYETQKKEVGSRESAVGSPKPEVE